MTDHDLVTSLLSWWRSLTPGERSLTGVDADPLYEPLRTDVVIADDEQMRQLNTLLSAMPYSGLVAVGTGRITSIDLLIVWLSSFSEALHDAAERNNALQELADGYQRDMRGAGNLLRRLLADTEGR